MSDLISRDMALEKMADYVASGYADSAEDFEEYSRIICQLPSVNPQPKTGRWIPVSERLPENSGNYLITYYLPDEIDTQEAVYVKEGDKWFDMTDIEISLAVIAWMPLPKPYYPWESEVEE